MENNNQQIKNLSDGGLVSGRTSEINWLKTSTLTSGLWGEITASSPDGSLEFKNRVAFSEEIPRHELSIREIYDHATGKLLYELLLLVRARNLKRSAFSRMNPSASICWYTWSSSKVA